MTCQKTPCEQSQGHKVAWMSQPKMNRSQIVYEEKVQGGEEPELRREGVWLSGERISVWEQSSGPQTYDLYDAFEHLHGIEVSPVEKLAQLLECEPHQILQALSQFFAAGGLLSDLMDALDAYEVPYIYTTRSSNGEFALRGAQVSLG